MFQSKDYLQKAEPEVHDFFNKYTTPKSFNMGEEKY